MKLVIKLDQDDARELRNLLLHFKRAMNPSPTSLVDLRRYMVADKVSNAIRDEQAKQRKRIHGKTQS